MEDDKPPARPRERAAQAKPTDTSNPSVTPDPPTAEAGTAPRPRKVPPATFVPPVAPSQPASQSQPTVDPPPLSTAPLAPSPQTARKSPAKVAKKAAKKAPAVAPPPRDTPPPRDASATESPAPAKAQPVAKAPAKKVAKKVAPNAAAAKEATPAAATTPATPAPEITESTPIPTPAPAPSTTPAPRAVPLAPPAPLWPTIKANPGYATELLALAAVEHLGPQARTVMAWLRDTYPTATTHGLARIATSRSVRQARTQGAMTGLLGPLAVLAGTGALLWTQARLVLDIAAAYGRDPAEPERAIELLALLRVHPDLTAAREAVAAARVAAADAAGAGGDRQVPLPLVRVAGRALGRMTIARRAARLVPGAGAALTGILDGRATEQLAVRATKFYRG